MTVSFIVLAVFLSFSFLRASNEASTNEDTYRFIDQNLRNPNGTFATYLRKNTEADADEVQGREALSETVGLWMEYALVSDNKNNFEEAYQQLHHFFLDSRGFIYWKISEEGKREEYINALIDDIRIIKALWTAHERWGDNRFSETADHIGKAIGENNVYDSVMIDFFDKSIGYSSDFLTTSYVSIEDLEMLHEKGYISSKVYAKTYEVINDLPTKNGFYPKTYIVDKNKMEYDSKVNMIDQLIVAPESPGDSEALTSFIEQEMEKKGVLHGIYSLKTKDPLVDYESPAIYALLIDHAIKQENKVLAIKTYERMIKFREKGAKYPGAYSIGTEDNTHIFDNLLPMIAIEKLKNKGWLKGEA